MPLPAFVGYNPFPVSPVADPGIPGAGGDVTLGFLKQQALLLLAQESDSDVASLPTGVGGADTITSTTQMRTWANEGAAILARTCLPLPGSGIKTLGTGEETLRLSTLSMPASLQRFFAIASVSVGGVPLQHITRVSLENHFPDFATAQGTPAYWYSDGESRLGIYPGPASGATKTLSVAGFGTPTELVDDADTLDWLPVDLASLLACYMASLAALKSFENPALFGRAAIWMGQWDAGRLLLWQQIDSRTREQHFPLPPGVTSAGRG